MSANDGTFIAAVPGREITPGELPLVVSPFVPFSLANGSGLGEGNAPLSAFGVPDGEGGLAKLIRTGPAPGKISLLFNVAFADMALSKRSKLTKPQFLWVRTRAEMMEP